MQIDSSRAAAPHTDIRVSWFERLLPDRLRPYARLARLDRPIGWWLLLLPCWWSSALASPGDAPLGLILLFWIGAVAMRGAGCTLNDMIDRDVDAKVERTRGRPLPAGEVTLPQAAIFMMLQSAVGALVLFSLNRLSIVLGVAILLIVATYPFMKRLTFWPQFFLGLSFNWGALIGWTAVTGRLQWPAVALYLAGILWTLGYDTIYAHQDKADDVGAGVKSTALRFGEASKAWIALFYALTIIGVGIALALVAASIWGYLALALAATHLAWHLLWWRPDDPADCLKRFQANRNSGLLIFLACMTSGL